MLPTLLNLLSATLDYHTRQYPCEVVSGDEVKRCFEIRRTVFGAELKREGGGPAEIDEFDSKSVHIACKSKKTKEWVGCIRVTMASHFRERRKYENEYHLDEFPADFLKYVVTASRLAVLKPHRKSPAGLLLALKSYEVAVRDLGAQAAVINCEPGLYPFYCRLGYRPMGRVFVSPFGGYRVPLYLVPHDYKYFQQRHSPFLEIAKKLNYPKKTGGLEWQLKREAAGSTIDVGINLISPGNSGEYHAALAGGMSPAGRRELCAKASQIRCSVGDVVLAKGEGSRFLGFVHKGILEVRQAGQTLAILGEGDIFGELAFVLAVPRTADVIARAPGTEIVLLSLSAIDRLKSPGDKVIAWKNLASIIARRSLGNPSITKQ